MRIGSFGEVRRRGRAYGPLPIIGGGGAGGLRPQDVFAAVPYSWDGSAPTTIPTPFDPDAAWLKSRNVASDHYLFSKIRGNNKFTKSDTTDAEAAAGAGFGEFVTGGFKPAGASGLAMLWAWKKAAKFYTEVVYTGDGTNNRPIAHDLGIPPGMIAVKRLDAAGSWYVQHVSLGPSQELYLEQTAAMSSSSKWGNTAPTSTAFTVNTTLLNASGGTYLAKLWAHDPDTTNGIIQWGSFTQGAGDTAVNVGWQPQWGVFKNANSVGSWFVYDSARGWTPGTQENYLRLDGSAAETNSGGIYCTPTNTGFISKAGNFSSGTVQVYGLIRSPV